MNIFRSKILIVESSRPLAELWASYLEKRGYDTHVFVEGASDPRVSRQWGLPDIILSGLDQHGRSSISGEDICVDIYGAQAKGHFAPVIRVTSSAAPAVAEASKAPAFLFLRKPVKLSAMAAAVRRAWYQAVLSDAQKNRNPVMTADVADQGLRGVLQFIEAGSRTGLLLTQGGASGEALATFSAGAPEAAFCGDLAGDEAIIETFFWTGGKATFFSGPPSPPEAFRNVAARSNGELLARIERELPAIRRAEAEVASQNAMLIPGEVQRPPESPLEEAILANAARRATFNELAASLPSATRRQLLLAIGRLLDGDALGVARSAPPRDGFSQDFKDEILRGIREDPDSLRVIHPRRVGVFGAAPSLSHRFLGSLCGEELASGVIVQYMHVMLLVSDLGSAPPAAADLFDYSAAIVLGDMRDPAQAARASKLLDAIAASPVHAVLLATPMGGGGMPERLFPLPEAFRKGGGKRLIEGECSLEKGAAMRTLARLIES